MPSMSLLDDTLSVATRLDGLWNTLVGEARRVAAADPVLCTLIELAVLRHGRFAATLGCLLARKLGDPTLPGDTVANLVDEAVTSDPAVLDAAASDLIAVYERDPACPDHLTPLLFFKGYQALQAHRVAHVLWRDGRRHLASWFQSRVSEVFGLDIHPAARVGRRILIDHGTAIVVGETAVIEDDVSILQGVTLGGTGKTTGDRHPKIRRGVLIGAGAKVLGGITVGEGAKVGAGSIVLENVAPYTTVVGNPARPVGTRHTQLPALTMDQSLPALDYVI